MISILYDTFKKWSIKGSVYIISDPHFSDQESFEFRTKNNKIPDGIKTAADLAKAAKLPKELLLSERELDNHVIFDNKLFDEVYSGPLMISDKIILSHEPIIPCPDYLVNLCGHVHAKGHKFEVDKHLYYNFCAEAIDYKPVSLGELIKDGLLSKVNDIHRVTVDGAIIRKKHRAKR